ncbi:hypothetical protein LA76x_0296 [Lysobacter antibioticus]|uniref:Uncharacterized protein n=1 Tax=Lysobacter antibioticus TaxID=84531 RepID=A0A0S2F4J6_LYSAN|nr:hypothetical protein LA76x_0296 [Lysobacter antibioticus]
MRRSYPECDRSSGRSGASRDIAAAVLLRIAQSSQIKIKIKPKASAAEAAGYFLLSKATKVRLDSLRSKVTKEVAFL